MVAQSLLEDMMTVISECCKRETLICESMPLLTCLEVLILKRSAVYFTNSDVCLISKLYTSEKHASTS